MSILINDKPVQRTRTNEKVEEESFLFREGKSSELRHHSLNEYIWGLYSLTKIGGQKFENSAFSHIIFTLNAWFCRISICGSLGMTQSLDTFFWSENRDLKHFAGYSCKSILL